MSAQKQISNEIVRELVWAVDAAVDRKVVAVSIRAVRDALVDPVGVAVEDAVWAAVEDAVDR